MLKAIIWATIISSLKFSICPLIALSLRPRPATKPPLHTQRDISNPKSDKDTVLQDQVHAPGLSPPIHPSRVTTYSQTDPPPCHTPCCLHTRHAFSSSHACPPHLAPDPKLTGGKSHACHTSPSRKDPGLVTTPAWYLAQT